MADNEIIKAGDICTYSYFNANKSLSIVEVVKDLSEEVAVVKFHQIIFDDSGNDFFTYLHNTGKTMNVSKKYLRKIDLINRQKAEIERLKGWENLFKAEKHSLIKAEAVKKFAERLKKEAGYFGRAVAVEDIDNLVKEFTKGCEGT